MQHPLYQQADYLKSVPTLSQCPPDILFEVAFAGRSNAGKSSALNTITTQKSLARTSKTPGRTQLINFFQLDKERALVDLPGYGYAKVNLATKQAWEAGLSEYIEKRAALKGLVILMDCRHPITDVDLLMLDWTQEIALPVHILLTKADKLKRGPAKANLLALQKQLAPYSHASAQLFSALNKQGLQQAWQHLDKWLHYDTPTNLTPSTNMPTPSSRINPPKKKKNSNIRRFN